MSAHTRIPVAVLGATGSVGQRFVSLLADHPWFEIYALTGSERSTGKAYGDAVTWTQEALLPGRIADLPVLPTAPPLPRLCFSALDGEIAGPLESELAASGAFVVSNAKSHRMDADVPLVVPEVNPDHLDLVRSQGFPDGGAIVTNPNCSTIGLVLALKPLDDAFGVEAVSVVTLQAVSGAGLPGVPSLRILDNVLPFIAGEEDKIEGETRKILGQLQADGVAPASMTVSAQCNRVAVSDGHIECVSVRFRRRPEIEEVARALAGFRAEPQSRGLPSAPPVPIEVVEEEDRPQPRLDRGRGRGMALTVGRLRRCPILDVKFVALSHNTVRGAAGGSILLAELALARGLVREASPPEAE